MSNTLIFLLILIGLVLFFGTALLAGVLAAPWLPTRKKDLKRLLDLASIQRDELVYDLGSGDGRLLINAAKQYGARGVGFEISFFHWLWSILNVWLSGCQGRIKIRYRNFFREDFGPADVIVCFLTPWAMRKLKPKVAKELRPGSRFVSYSFSLPDSQPVAVSKPESNSNAIYLYNKPVRKIGNK
ncbi:MAG: class I SAM-dependent methyltransferase [Patescibacteria group bacterium]|nr:class I SAM-dependent methyltransferase [Patescibacteria group bacterium]